MSLTTRAGIIADTDCVTLCEVDTLTGFANNDPVGAVPDQSGWVAFAGGTKQFQQGTGANKPLYLTNQRNGLPALSFDGSNDFLESSPRQATEATLFIVRKLSSASPGSNKVQYQCSGPGSRGLGVYQSSASPGKHSAYLRGNTAIVSSTDTTTNWEVVILACGSSGGSAGNTKMYVDGTEVISTTDLWLSNNSDSGIHFIGKDDSGTLMSGAMLVGAWGYFKRKLSPSDVADLTAYFQGLWGDIPGTPSALDVQNETGTTLDLAWSAPVGGGTVTSYQVRIDGGAASTSTSPHTFTGLTPGTSHTLEVRAVGPGGNGAWASITGDTLALPGVPTSVAGTPDFESIDLTWDAPASGGTVTSYQVRIDGGTPATATSPHTFTGLDPGTSYTVGVRAVGPGGSSAWVEVEVETLDDTVTALYHVDLRIGAHTWAIDHGDDPDPDAPNPLAGATFSWGVPDDIGWPPRAYHHDPDTLTVRVRAADAADLDDIRRYDVVRFAFTPQGYGLTHPLVDFAGRVTSTPQITRHPAGGVVLEVTAVDHRVNLALVTIFGKNPDEGGEHNGEPDDGIWNVGVPGYDGRALIDGAGTVDHPVDGLVAWGGVYLWIDTALAYEGAGDPWIPAELVPLDIFDGVDQLPVVASGFYQSRLTTYEYGADLVTLDAAYKAVGVYPWPTHDDDGELTGFKFLDPDPTGIDYTLSDIDGGTVLGAVEWRRGVHPEWVEVKVPEGEVLPPGLSTVNTTGQTVESWPSGALPELVIRRTLEQVSYGDFIIDGFLYELPTDSWFPYKFEVIADLAPETVDGWFNYPDRVSKVVRIDNIETERHPVDPHGLTPAEVPDDVFVGRLSRASLTIAANGRWSVVGRLRPRLHADIIADLYPPP